MSEDGVPDPHIERRKDPSGAKIEAWKETLETMEEIAEDRRNDGWEVVTVRAAHTDTVSKDMREHDRFGLMHVVPRSDGERFADAYDPEEFTEFLVYGADVSGFMYAVTELIDPEAKRSILIASQYDMTRARGMVQNAHEEGVLYTYVKKIDGTILGKFEHEEFEPLLKRPPT